VSKRTRTKRDQEGVSEHIVQNKIEGARTLTEFVRRGRRNRNLRIRAPLEGGKGEDERKEMLGGSHGAVDKEDCAKGGHRETGKGRGWRRPSPKRGGKTPRDEHDDETKGRTSKRRRPAFGVLARLILGAGLQGRSRRVDGKPITTMG